MTLTTNSCLNKTKSFYKRKFQLSVFFNKIKFGLNVSRFFCSHISNKKTKFSNFHIQCAAIIQSKRSKLYNCRCPHPVKIGDYCKKHKKTPNIEIILKKKVATKVVKEITTKKELGQFYSINCDYILQGM
jgi:hypothetical protein